MYGLIELTTDRYYWRRFNSQPEVCQQISYTNYGIPGSRFLSSYDINEVSKSSQKDGGMFSRSPLERPGTTNPTLLSNDPIGEGKWVVNQNYYIIATDGDDSFSFHS